LGNPTFESGSRQPSCSYPSKTAKPNQPSQIVEGNTPAAVKFSTMAAFNPAPLFKHWKN